MNRKAAVEFSANVIVVMIISTVILGLGLMLFFNLRSQASTYTEAIEDQTAEQLKALMLNDNSKVAIYPNDLTIQKGKSAMTTVAVSSFLESGQFFGTPGVNVFLVEYFKNSTSEPLVISSSSPAWWGRNNNSIIVSKVGIAYYLNFGKLNPGEQGFRNILIKMPKTALKGQYVITINITNTTSGTGMCDACPPYALTKLYVTVP